MTYFKNLILLSLSLAIFPVFAMENSEKSVGRLASVTGEVWLNDQPGKPGMKVSEGSRIRTKQGKCTLLLGASSVIHLDVETEFVVKEYHIQGKEENEAEFDLKFGRTRALIRNTGKKKKFRFQSRSATMGVRGTHVFIETPKNVETPQTFLTIEGDASVAIPTAQGAPRSIQLKPRQAMEIGSSEGGQGSGGVESVNVRQMGAEEVQEIAESVAPPPQEFQTQDQMQNPDRKPRPPREHHRFGPDIPIPPGFFAPVDPVADNRPPAKVTISVQRKNGY